MTQKFPTDALTKLVIFPKALLAVEYVIEDQEVILFFSKYETYNSETELINEAHQNAVMIADNSKHFHATSVIIIPLLLSSTRNQKKSYWSPSNDASVNDWLIYKQTVTTAMLKDFDKHQAVVTCGYYDQNDPVFCCAGYYPSEDKKSVEELIKKSRSPADPLVKNFAIYDIVKPYRYPLDDRAIKTMN